MEIYKSLDAVSLCRPVVTLGFFDGVHLGHQALLATLQRESARLQSPSLVITLWPHPRIVLGINPGGVQLINSLEQKERVLSNFSIDALLELEFTPVLAALSAEEFLQLLCDTLKPRAFLMGYDHHFGAKGRGDFELLRAFTAARGIESFRQEALHRDGAELSSTLIRGLLNDGDMEAAERLMGRPFSYRGCVVPGQAIGRTLGFPTANVKAECPWQLIPGKGVYRGECLLGDGRTYHALINVGERPTVAQGAELNVEAYLLDFAGNLYGDTVELVFHSKVRDEVKFSTREELKQAIARDVRGLRDHLSSPA